MGNLLRLSWRAAFLGSAILISGTASSATLMQDQDPSPGESVPGIAAWIEKLSSDSPEERDAATGELRKVGPGAVPFLKEAFKKSKDAETRARLEQLLSELDLPALSTFFLSRLETREPGGEREKAVLAALLWLAKHQNSDGSWGADRFSGRCTGTKCAGNGERDHDVGVSALSILAFLGAGYSQDSRDELSDPARNGPGPKVGDGLMSGLKWLIAQQDREGCVGERGMKHVYNHAIATLALAEAYGMTRSEFLKVPTQKAVDFLLACQNLGKGWRYSLQCGDNDSSVTGWAVKALEVAKYASLKVPKETFEGAIAWFDEVTEQNGYYQVGYNARSTGKVYVPGKNEEFEHHATMSAVGISARIFIQRRKTAPELAAQVLMTADLPEWKPSKIDFYYWYFGSLALFQADGPDGRLWERWNSATVRALVPHQKTADDGCQNGSWDPSMERWGFEGGRVYATALNALTLETPRRYPVVAARKWAPR